MTPQRGLLTVLMMLILVACATQSTKPPPVKFTTPVSNDGYLSVPLELRPQVAFWRNVYTVWGRGQVAFHDDRYLNLVYEVVTVPGPVDENSTPEQKEWLKARYEGLKFNLRELEDKIAVNEPLTPTQQALAARITASGGPTAIMGASNRLRSQRGLRERFKHGLEISGRYDVAFRQVFREAGLPEDLAYLPHVESSFQNHAASSAGAVGIWQFMPDTARRQGMIVNAAVDERRDPVASARGAARYLGNAYARLGSWPLAITSYNHGVNGMARAQEEFGNDIVKIIRGYSGRGFGFASRNFYTEFLAAREIARNPQQFFPEGIAYESPPNLDQARLGQTIPASILATYHNSDFN
ncbi:MAG: lytic transglycosylase domain-containing protein [Candidatus Competibacteraceae bacterium]